MDSSTFELVERYREALHGLVDYLDQYGKSTYTNRKVAVHVTALEKCFKRKHTHTGMDGLWTTVREVRGIVDDLYSGVLGYSQYPFQMFEDDRPFTVTYETHRLEVLLPQLGVRGLFEKYDEEKIRKDFYRGGPRNHQTVFKSGVDTLTKTAETWSKLTSADELSDMCTNYLVHSRSLARVWPNQYDWDIRTNLYQCYGNHTIGVQFGEQYVRTLSSLQYWTDKMLDLCGREVTPNPQPMSLKLDEYLQWIEYESHRMEDLYVELIYRLILRVV